MKKLIFTLFGILLGFYIFLTVISSNRDYKSEKLLYRANKALNKSRLNRDATPEQMFASIENDFKKVIAKFPDSPAAKMSQVKLTEFYFENQKFDEVIRSTDTLIDKYKDDAALACQAGFLKARAYEKKGEWNKAVAAFEELQKKYPNTPIALQVPLYIADNYKARGDAKKSAEETEKAISYYTKLKDEKKGTLLGYMSASLLLQAYVKNERYKDAGMALEAIVRDYPAEPILSQQLPLVEFIFVKNLQDKAKAIELYTYIKERISNETHKKILERRIVELRK